MLQSVCRVTENPLQKLIMLNRIATVSLKKMCIMMTFFTLTAISYAQGGMTTLLIGQNTSSSESVYETLATLGLEVSDEITQLNIVCVEVPDNSVIQIVEQLQSQSSVEFVEENAVVNGNS